MCAKLSRVQEYYTQTLFNAETKKPQINYAMNELLLNVRAETAVRVSFLFVLFGADPVCLAPPAGLKMQPHNIKYLLNISLFSLITKKTMIFSVSVIKIEQSKSKTPRVGCTKGLN